MAKVVIIYHYPCPDGIYGALAAYLHFTYVTVPPPPIRFFPLTVWSKPEEREKIVSAIMEDEDVYLIDFSGGVDFMTGLCQNAKSVTLLDHHADTFEILPSFLLTAPKKFHHTVDMARSGAMLAWDHFNLGSPPYTAFGGDEVIAKRVGLAFSLIQDGDLFQWKLDGAKGFYAGFGELKLEYDPSKNPDIWSSLLSLDTLALSTSGKSLLEEQAKQRASEREEAFEVSIPSPEGFLSCLAIISKLPHLRSLAGSELAELSQSRGLAPASVISYFEAAAGDGVIKVSLRSLADFDIMTVARFHGGGGHKVSTTVLFLWGGLTFPLTLTLTQQLHCRMPLAVLSRWISLIPGKNQTNDVFNGR